MSSRQVLLSSRLARLERAFQENFRITYLEIENESLKHSGHFSGDGETHWRVLLVAENFLGLSRVQRHQKVNQLLQDEFSSGLHALSLKLLDPKEWDLLQDAHFEET